MAPATAHSATQPASASQGFTGDGVTRSETFGVVHASRVPRCSSIRCATYADTAASDDSDGIIGRNDRPPRSAPRRPAEARPPDAQHRRGRGRGHRGHAAGHGVRHRLGRDSRAGPVHRHRRRPRHLVVRRHTRADLRAHRRLHRRARRHHRAVRHRGPAGRHRDGGFHPAGHGTRAARQRDQVHPEPGHRRLHGRHRRDHLDRPVEGFLRPAPRRVRPALPREIRRGAARASRPAPRHHADRRADARHPHRGQPLVRARAGPEARADAARWPCWWPWACRLSWQFRGRRHHRQRVRRHSARAARLLVAGDLACRTCCNWSAPPSPSPC